MLVDVDTVDPVAGAAILSARLHVRPDDAETLALVERLWLRCANIPPTSSYGEGSILFGPCLAFRFAQREVPAKFLARAQAIYDTDVEGTRPEGCDEVALWTIFTMICYS